jgi:MoaA/NifB/PqqE/SkfB family radical SAM enzyme
MIKPFLFDLLKKKKERFPRLLSIELSSICNAACIMCPHSEMERTKKNMSLEMVEKIAEDCIGKPLRKINLFWFGDSLSHKKVIDAIRIIRHKLPNVKLYLSTNAGLLWKDRSQMIIDEKLLDVINFDIDGITKETFENIRLKLKFDEVMENVHYFLDYQKQQKVSKPQTRVTIIKMEPTMAEIEEFKKYWSPLVDKVDVNVYNTFLGTQEDRNVGEAKIQSKEGKFEWACTHPCDELVIAADGIAGLCCLDYDLNAPVGDIKNQSIEQVWQGEELQSYRQKMLELNYDDIDVCKDCNAYIYQKESTWAKLQT